MRALETKLSCSSHLAVAIAAAIATLEEVAKRECNQGVRAYSSKHPLPPPATMQLGGSLLHQALERILHIQEHEVHGKCKGRPSPDSKIQN